MQANALEELRRIILYMNQSGVPLPPAMAATCAAAATLPSLQAHFSTHQHEMPHNFNGTSSITTTLANGNNYNSSKGQNNNIRNLANISGLHSDKSLTPSLTTTSLTTKLMSPSMNCSQCNEKP